MKCNEAGRQQRPASLLILLQRAAESDETMTIIRGRAERCNENRAEYLNLLAPEGRTEAANAKRLVSMFGSDLHWCELWKKWLAWDSTHWSVDDTRKIDSCAKAVVDVLWAMGKKLRAKAEKESDESKKVSLIKAIEPVFAFAKQSSRAPAIANMITLAKSEPGIPILPDALDADPWALCVANGVVDLRTGELRAHRREDYFTKVSPVAYDRSADCPTWMNFLDQIFSGKESILRFVRRAVGFSITASVAEHALFFCYGTGANGKSTFLNTLLAMLGEDYSAKAPTDLLLAKKSAHPTELTLLWGRRLVACVEAESGRRLAEAAVKEMTGGDKITARRMREDFWSFNPSHKLWLAANHKPIVRGTDHGIWRRIKLIPFTVTIPKERQDKQLPEKLLAELPGILNWAVKGCTEWQADGLDEPEEVTGATAEYRQEQDVLGRFVEECCVVDPAAKAQATPLYQAYRAWCEANGEHALNLTNFGTELTERGFEKGKSRVGITRLGIGLLKTAEV